MCIVAFKISRYRLRIRVQVEQKWYQRLASAIGHYHIHSTNQVILPIFQDEAAMGHRMQRPLGPHLQLLLDVSAPVPNLEHILAWKKFRFIQHRSATTLSKQAVLKKLVMLLVMKLTMGVRLATIPLPLQEIATRQSLQQPKIHLYSQNSNLKTTITKRHLAQTGENLLPQFFYTDHTDTPNPNQIKTGRVMAT